MRHYAFNVGDYAAATAHLTDAEDLAYRRLLDAYYAREAPLPVDEAACARLARASSQAARKAVSTVLREFFTLEADGWHQKRADAEIERQHIKTEQARSAVNVRHDRDREAKRANEQRRADERSTGVVRTYSENFDARIPPTTHEVTTTKPTPPLPAGAPPPKALGKRLPDDWQLPQAWGEWALAERPDLDRDAVRRIAAMFADHWRAKTGSDARKADWEATWRNWVRREKAMNPKRADAREARRSASVSEILGAVNHEKPADDQHPRDITGEAERVA